MTYAVTVEYPNRVGDGTYRMTFVRCPDIAEELATGSLLIHTEKGQELWIRGQWNRVVSEKE